MELRPCHWEPVRVSLRTYGDETNDFHITSLIHGVHALSPQDRENAFAQGSTFDDNFKIAIGHLARYEARGGWMVLEWVKNHRSHLKEYWAFARADMGGVKIIGSDDVRDEVLCLYLPDNMTDLEAFINQGNASRRAFVYYVGLKEVPQAEAKTA
ncbi:MAG: hypothetical protein WAX89_00625 [Alphaproteobacteria bacterium]